MKNVSCQTLRMNSDERWISMNIAHHQSNCSFRAARFRIAFAALKAKNAKVPELGRKIGFCPLDSLGFSLRGTHFIIIAIDSC